MKKNLIIALALVAGASLSTVDAAKKKKVVVAAQAPVVEKISLNSSSDSVSYAAGMSATQGLLEYLLQQKVDTAYMADFISGFKETVVKDVNDPKIKAYNMGTTIAQQLKERMLPQFVCCPSWWLNSRIVLTLFLPTCSSRALLMRF